MYISITWVIHIYLFHTWHLSQRHDVIMGCTAFSLTISTINFFTIYEFYHQFKFNAFCMTWKVGRVLVAKIVMKPPCSLRQRLNWRTRESPELKMKQRRIVMQSNTMQYSYLITFSSMPNGVWFAVNYIINSKILIPIGNTAVPVWIQDESGTFSQRCHGQWGDVIEVCYCDAIVMSSTVTMPLL